MNFPIPDFHNISDEQAVENALGKLSAIVTEPWFPGEVDRVLRINHTISDNGWAEEVMKRARLNGWKMGFHAGVFHIWRPNMKLENNEEFI